MIDLKIVSYKDGIFITRQDFEVNGRKYYIVNEGPYEVRKINKLRMRLRGFFGLKNPANGVVYETKK